MKVNDYKSQCNPKLNAKILRVIEDMVCEFRTSLPSGWRCCVEFQREEDQLPYYQLDIESNQGGGEFAPVKMSTLKAFPTLAATGTLSLPMITDWLSDTDCSEEFFKHLVSLHDVSDLTQKDWDELKELGVTHWYGGVRIPYDILVTEYKDALTPTSEQIVRNTKGEIRITFSGAKEWQDMFFCFYLFRRIQAILNILWEQDQIWYNLRGLNDQFSTFWKTAMNVQEALEK